MLDGLNAEKYYAQMGIAWAVATIMGKYPEMGLKYLQSKYCHLNKATYNKAIQKTIESYRVSDDMKNAVRKLKR